MADFQDKKIRQLNTLIEMTAIVNSSLDSSVVRQKAIEAATKLLSADAGSLLLVEPKTGELFFEVAVGEKCEEVKKVRLDRGLGIAGFVAEQGEPIIANNTQSDPRFFRGVDEHCGFETRNLICVPVKLKDKVIGVLEAINKIDGDFEYDDMVVLYALANQVAVAIENASLYREAMTDGLTGLYHHKYFELRLKEEIDRSKRYKHPLTLILADVDLFKQINDTYGHLAGDTVLEGVAKIFKDSTRLSDVVARYGGEEFGAILPYANYKSALIVGERFRKLVEDTDFNGVKVTISVGIGYFDGDNITLDHKNLLEIADKALYKAKDGGRNKVEIMV